MDKICKNHGTCCKEWGIPALIIGVIFLFSMICPEKFGKIIAFMGTGFGLLIVGTFITTATGLIVRRKMQVSAWERDRPFNDGDDDTPDPYLFNPGPGATWGLRAFMPDVESYSFAKTPISWLVKQAKRKVAILLADGTVSFPWFPVAWISEAAGGGTRIDVPEGWKITAKQADVLQKKREEIRNVAPRNRSEYQNDFMLFTSLIFSANSKIGREPVEVGIDKYALLLERIDRVESIQKEQIQIVLRDLSAIFGETKDLLALSERFKAIEETWVIDLSEPGTGELISLPAEPDTELATSNNNVATSINRLATTMQHVREAIINIGKDNACQRDNAKTDKPRKPRKPIYPAKKNGGNPPKKP